ncbi:hypothetical protein ACFX2J_024966 [Malus domestica]
MRLHFQELGSRDNGEDSLHDTVGATFEHQRQSLVEYLLCLVDDPTSRALVEVEAGSRRLLEQTRQLFSLGFQLQALLLRRTGLVGGLRDLVSEMDRFRQDLLHYVSHGSSFQARGWTHK